MKVNLETGLKRCPVCKQEKEIMEFNISKHRYDGHTNLCRVCSKKAHQDYYQNNLEKARAKRKEYRESHREQYKEYRQEHAEQIKETQQRWLKANKEIIREKAKLFRELHKEELREKARTYHLRSRLKTKDTNLRKKYGISLAQLTEAMEALNWKCPTCGATLTLEKGGYAVDHDHNTEGCHRGILCVKCNFILGHARDNAETLRNLAGFLENSRS